MICCSLGVRHVSVWSRFPSGSVHRNAAANRRSIHWGEVPPDAGMSCARLDQKYEYHALPYLLDKNGRGHWGALDGRDLITPKNHEFCCSLEHIGIDISCPLLIALPQGTCHQARQ